MPDVLRGRGHRSASAKLGAIGFSHQTCLPASRAAIAISAWNWLGVVTETTSTSGSSTTARQSPERLGEAEFAGACAGELLGDLAEMHQPGLGHVGKDGADRVPGERVALAHVARADQADADHFRFSAAGRIGWMS